MAELRTAERPAPGRLQHSPYTVNAPHMAMTKAMRLHLHILRTWTRIEGPRFTKASPDRSPWNFVFPRVCGGPSWNVVAVSKLMPRSPVNARHQSIASSQRRRRRYVFFASSATARTESYDTASVRCQAALLDNPHNSQLQESGTRRTCVLWSTIREHNAAPTDQNLSTQLCTTPSSPVGLVTNQPARLSVKKSSQSGSQAVTPPSRCSDPSLKPERSFVGSWLAKLSKHPFARHASTSPACFHIPGHVAQLVWVNKRILARQSWANWPHLVLVGRREKKNSHARLLSALNFFLAFNYRASLRALPCDDGTEVPAELSTAGHTSSSISLARVNRSLDRVRTGSPSLDGNWHCRAYQSSSTGNQGRQLFPPSAMI